jgi:hypothetical protein
MPAWLAPGSDLSVLRGDLPLLPGAGNKKIAVCIEDAGEGGIVRTKDLFCVGGCLLEKSLRNLVLAPLM